MSGYCTLCTGTLLHPIACMYGFIVPHTSLLSACSGFLCGQCPSGQGVDLTLIQCVECSVRDTILVAIVGKLQTSVVRGD